MAQASKVFISYSHDSPDHKDRILRLSNQLRAEGVDCQIDQYHESPAEGWPRWCEKQATDSEFVLVVCTETYLRRFTGEETPGAGLGGTWEGHIITQELYNAQGRYKKFIPITFAAIDKANVPVTLQGATRYDLPEDYEALYRRLTHQPLVTAPPLGELKAMPPRQNLPALPELPRKQDSFARYLIVAGNVYALDLRFEGDDLVGDLDEVQPMQGAVDGPIHIRWETVPRDRNYCVLLGGVAGVELPSGYEKLPQHGGVPISPAGANYFWDHVQLGYGSALVLLLPDGFTLSSDLAAPINCNVPGYTRLSAKAYNNRIAVLFLIEPDVGVASLRTTWRMAKFSGAVSAEVQRINALPKQDREPQHILVDQTSRIPVLFPPVIPLPPDGGSSNWWKTPAVIAAYIGLLGVLVTVYLQYFNKPVKTVWLAIFVKEQGSSDKPIPNAKVTLERPTRREEQTAESQGTARFQVDPEKEQNLGVTVKAMGYRDRSLSIGAPKSDGNYTVYLDPDPPPPPPPVPRDLGGRGGGGTAIRRVNRDTSASSRAKPTELKGRVFEEGRGPVGGAKIRFLTYPEVTTELNGDFTLPLPPKAGTNDLLIIGVTGWLVKSPFTRGEYGGVRVPISWTWMLTITVGRESAAAMDHAIFINASVEQYGYSTVLLRLSKKPEKREVNQFLASGSWPSSWRE